MPPITVRPPGPTTWQAFEVTEETDLLEVITWLHQLGRVDFEYYAGRSNSKPYIMVDLKSAEAPCWILVDPRGEVRIRILDPVEFDLEGWKETS